MLEVLKKMYEAEIEKARANISIFLENPAGIGDHSDIIGAVSYTHLTLPTNREV